MTYSPATIAASFAVDQTLPLSPANSPWAPAGERPLLFLDFEASSLSEASWPVEIGFARVVDGRVEEASAIIAPAADWSMTDWSATAAAVHGLTIEQVRAGCPAAAVAAGTDHFAGFIVVSDNPRWDQRWLDRLRAGRPRIEVHGLRQVAGSRLSGPAADMLAMTLLRSASTHHAAEDAARLAVAWRAALGVQALAA